MKHLSGYSKGRKLTDAGACMPESFCGCPTNTKRSILKTPPFMHLSEKSLTITTNNQTVSLIDEGSIKAPTIIFIHGFPLTKAMWEIHGNSTIS